MPLNIPRRYDPAFSEQGPAGTPGAAPTLNVSPEIKFIDPLSGIANFDTSVVNTEIPEEEIITAARSIVESRPNIYSSAIMLLSHDIAQLDLDGTIKKPDGSELSYDDAMRKVSGWKLHLNFDPDNPEVVANFMQLLDPMKAAGAVSTYKIGHGGGRKAGAPGKEATVYVGHRDKAQLVADFIGSYMNGDGLLAPEGEALHDDLPFNDLVVGRFEVTNTHFEVLSQYGMQGFGAPMHIIQRWLAEGFRKNMDPLERQQKLVMERQEAIEFITSFFGDYFTGKKFPADLTTRP